MAAFTIDDARDFYTEDVTERLEAIARTSDSFLALGAINTSVGNDQEGHSPFVNLGRECHSLFGSSATVSVTSIAESARLLEIISDQGERLLGELRAKQHQCQSVGKFIKDAIPTLSRMLELELEHQPAKANELGLELRDQAFYLDDQLEAFSYREAEESPHAALECATRDTTGIAVSGMSIDAVAAEGGEESTFEKGDGAAATAPNGDNFSFAEHDSELAGSTIEGAVGDGQEMPVDAEEAFSFAESPAPGLIDGEPASLAFPGTTTTGSPAEEEEEAFSFSEARTEDPVEGDAEAFSFAEASTSGTALEAEGSFSFDGNIDDGMAELRDIFKSEAQESLVALHGYINTLTKVPADHTAGEALERIYHTLKGAAAVVGLAEVSAIAAKLRELVSDQLETGGHFGEELLAQLIADTNEMLTRTGLPALEFKAASTSPAPLASLKLREIFFSEAREIVESIEQDLLSLPTADADQANVLRSNLGKLGHRLKGSAIINSEVALGQLAAEFEAACEASNSQGELTALLEAGLKSMRESLDLTAEPPASRAQSAKEAVVDERVAFKINAPREIWDAFLIETSELLETIERRIFDLEESEQPKRVLQDLFRSYHSLKGAVYTVGFSPLGDYIHVVEDYLEELDTVAILPPLSRLRALLLRIQDRVRRYLQQVDQGYIIPALDALHGDIGRLRRGAAFGPAASNPQQSRAASQGSHTSSVGSGSQVTGQRSRTERKFLRVATERLDGLMNLTGELVIERSRLGRRVVNLSGLRGELVVSRDRLITTIDNFREQYEFAGVGGRSKPSYGSSTAASTLLEGSASAGFSDLELDEYNDINILARTLNEISNDIGELQGQIGQTILEFSEDSESFGGIVSSLQGEITRARMVPVDRLFLRLRRAAYDAADRVNREIRFVSAGESVDLDKSIVEGLYLPLLHLVRNSVVHGIESPDRRHASGKEAIGMLSLSAQQESGQIVLKVSDDGGGLDLERLRQRGLQLGLITEDVPLEDPRIVNLVFESGLSTSSKGQVAGRGVGCDVVRREIEKLNGSVSVHSERGAGTTFTITLPLTLAITKALKILLDDVVYAIPMFFAERILPVKSARIIESAGIERVEVEKTLMLMHRLGALLGFADSDQDDDSIIVLAFGDRRLALRTPQVLGRDEIVVKSLGGVLSAHPLFSGITISGDGDMIPILDVPGLISKASTTQGSVQGFSKTLSPQAQKVEQRLRVLFVDDSLSVRKVAERFLNDLDLDLTLANDGADGLDKLRSGTFDLVFTDIEMPRMNGYELITALRFIPKYHSLPIVVVTSRSGRKHQEKAQQVGATDFISKPFTKDSLAAALSRYAGYGQTRARRDS